MKRIEMELDEALAEKWNAGEQRYRGNGEDLDGFVGDPFEELFDELLDAILYSRVLRTDSLIRRDRWQCAELFRMEGEFINMTGILQEMRRRAVSRADAAGSRDNLLGAVRD